MEPLCMDLSDWPRISTMRESIDKQVSKHLLIFLKEEARKDGGKERRREKGKEEKKKGSKDEKN